MSYRPEGMRKNPYPYNPNPTPKLNNTAYIAYEAGADALLEGLIKQPSKRGANVLYVDREADSSTILHRPRRKGHLVFIPEGKE